MSDPTEERLLLDPSVFLGPEGFGWLAAVPHDERRRFTDDPPRRVRIYLASGAENRVGRAIRVFGKGGKPRIVTISYEAARSLDRYLRARAKHPQAGHPGLWLGASGRGPLTLAGIYQLVVRRGEQAGVAAHPQRFRHHFSHTWLDRGGAPGDLMELNGWSSPQMLTWYGASARGARARRNYDRIMNSPR